MQTFQRLCGVFILGLLLPVYTMAGEPLPLRYAVLEAMGYPLNVFDTHGNLTGGLLKDMGEMLARELHAPLNVMKTSRRRVESELLQGNMDVMCYHSPQWSDNTGLVWSIPSVAQIERVVTPAGVLLSGNIDADFKGKRVGTQIGYHYPALAALIDKGETARVDESRVVLQFKALDMRHTDMLISSEGEIAGFLHERPDARAHYEISTFALSTVLTQCAISPKSRYDKSQIDKALGRVLKSGELERAVRHYGMSMR